MDLIKVTQHTSIFNGITQIIKDDEGNDMEIWFARDIQPLLGYARWEHFQVAINRAIESCKSQNINDDDHFREATKMVTLGSELKRHLQDFMLTRFACYLIAQKVIPCIR